jgi:hypothetical protein
VVTARGRIPIPLAGEASVLLGLEGGDALVLFGGLAAALGWLEPHRWDRWPVAVATLAVASLLLVRVQDDPLWRWLVHVFRFSVTPRHYRFDIVDEDGYDNLNEVSHHAFTHETALSVAGYRGRRVPDGP